jgi:hypothetical protein
MIRAEENLGNDNLNILNKFEKFFDLTPDLLCKTGFDGNFKKTNPTVPLLLLDTNNDLMSSPINEFVSQEDLVSTSLASNKLRKRVSLFNFKTRYSTTKGYIARLLCASLPVESNKVVSAIAKYITSKKEIEEKRNFHFTEATKINNYFKQLTYRTANDLRSPVNNLLTVFELLDICKISDSKTLKFISLLKSTTEELKSTINDYVTILKSQYSSLKNILLYATFLVLISTTTSSAQEDITKQDKYTSHNKGKFFLSWGGNRINYSKSDITFRGNDYNFTLDNITAHDKPKGFHIDYINPAKITVPQTNFRMGYFITDHYSVAIGVDHMKYVMMRNQIANITGTIAANTDYDGIYNDTPKILTDDFLMYEHTDGLNYVNTEISRHDDISTLFKIGNTDKIQVNLTEGVGLGLLYPKTNTRLLGKERHDDFHVSGYGTSLKAGLNITFFKHFYIKGELKGGYINMQDIRTTQSTEDSASQDFFFFQRVIAIGVIFRI